MDRPKRKSTMTPNDVSNSDSTSKRNRQDKTNESPNIAGGSNISTGQSGNVKSSTTPRSIENLPSELLIKIIEFLPVAQWSALERVHPNIRDVVYTAWGSLKKIDIQRDLLPRQRLQLDGAVRFRNKTIAVVEKLCKRAPNLIDIAVDCSRITAARCLRSIMAQLVEFKKLQRIDFGEDCLTTSSLSRFVRESASRDQLKEIVNMDAAAREDTDEDQLSVAFDNSNYNDKPLRLETMDFESKQQYYATISWEFLAVVDVSRLTTFRVRNTEIPQRVLANLLDRSSQLRQLSFDFGCQYTHDVIPHLSANANEIVLEANKRIISAIARMDGLESLIMGSSFYSSTCQCGNFNQQLTGLLITLGQRPSFKELGMVGQLTNPTFMASVAAAIPTLESLSLKIGDLTTPILDAIFLPQSNLRKLHVSAYWNPAGAGFFNIINHVVQNAPTLETLILNLPLKTFSGDDLKSMGGLMALRELKLDSRAENMNDAVLKAWGDGFGGNLTKLEIKNCGSSITDDAFIKLIEKSPNLNTLIVENYSITNGILEKLAALSPKIEEFGCDCAMVTNIGLQHVVDGFHRLKKLDLKKVNRRLKKNLNLNFGKYRVVNVSVS